MKLKAKKIMVRVAPVGIGLVALWALVSIYGEAQPTTQTTYTPYAYTHTGTTIPRTEIP